MGVGLLGEIDAVYISSPGKDFSSAPLLVPVYGGTVGCGGSSQRACAMTHSVTQIVKNGGRTRGCGVGSIIVPAPGSGGSGFQAKVVDSDDLGEILKIAIIDHGSGYTSAPKLIMTIPGSCKCGSYIVDGQATFDSFAEVGVAGAFDPCFVAVVALKGSLTGNGGWSTRNVRLCARFGASSMWSQISSTTVRLLLPEKGVFTPVNVNSGQLFTLELSGTGFESDGQLQLRVKVAYSCDVYQGSDMQGVLPGGWGRPCDSISVSGSIQTCRVKFKLVQPGTVVQAQICKRTGGGLYSRSSDALLNVNGFQLLSVTPTYAASNTPYIVTVRGINFDSSLFDQSFAGILKAKVCPEYVCKGTHVHSNDGEPCAGTNDQRMCTADAYCVSEVVCRADTNGSTGVFFPGGSTSDLVRVQNCNSENYACTEAVFEWTLMSMANVNAQIYWMFDFMQYATFQLLPNSRLLIEGSWLTSFEQIPPSPIFSGTSIILNVTGKNLVNSGPGAVKFKWANNTYCEAMREGDVIDTFVGGDGRVLDSVGGNLLELHGQVKFVLSYPFRLAPLKPAVVCWKIGDYKYREIETYDKTTLDAKVLGITGFSLIDYRHTTNVYGTWVDGMKPTDFNFTRSTKISVGNQQLPVYASGSAQKITVYGARFGSSAADSPLVIRPIAMPFAQDATAIQCIETDTTDETRSNTCKEFKYSIDAYDGGASRYCEGGSSIDSAPIEDYYPTSIKTFMQTKDGITTEMSYAVFDFSKVLMEHSARFLVCWRMSRTDHFEFPWASIGHIDYRQRNLGVQGIISWDVWVTHTFGMTGAYVESVRAEPEIVANRPFKLTMVALGVGCDNAKPQYKVKLSIGNGLQAVVGGKIGGGCSLGVNSDSEGAVIGGEAVIPTCRPDLKSGLRNVVEMEFTVLVEASTRLEFCWSSTAGTPYFKSAFYVGGQTFVTLESKPWYVTDFRVNDQPIASAAKLMAHRPFSLTILGQGLQKSGPVKLNLTIAEDCTDLNTIVPGGDWRTVDCMFGHQSATVEWNIYRPVQTPQVCLTSTASSLVWNRFLERSRYYCTPAYCGAPRCVPSTNYLFDDFGCDEDCCQLQCQNDPFCNYWQRYEIPGRTYRKCQTMAHCENPSILMQYDRNPIIWQKTYGLRKEVYVAGILPEIESPVVFDVTPQVNPPLRARIPFVVNVQGTGFVSSHVQIHVKISNTRIGCNDAVALNKTLTQWNQVKAEREGVFSQLEAAKNFSYNGTCGGGNNNCAGGPAPAETICLTDNDCIPAAGGVCVPPNTGTSCLHDEQCTFKGFCNNSLYNLSITPPPEPPPMQIPFVEVSDAGTLMGGQGKFLTVKNFSFGFTTFQIDEAAKGVLCYAIRNPEAERHFISEDGFITDLKLISTMSGYVATRELEILEPVISTVTPDHAFLFVETDYTVMGLGISHHDKIKLVHPSQGCTQEGLPPAEADLYGAVRGAAGVRLDFVNSVGTLGTVRLKISEPLKPMIDDNQLEICYMIVYPGKDPQYRKVGNLFVANSPPIVTSFGPSVMYYTEPTHIVLQGMALGAAQKIKLIDADKFTCSGEVMNDQIRDEYAVAPGSLSSFLTLKNAGDYYEIFQDPYTNHAYFMQSEGMLNIISDSQDEKTFTLCLKYGDLSLAGGTPGYIAVGNISAKPPTMHHLGSAHIFSGRQDTFLIVGAGLLSKLELSCKLVHKYHLCSGMSKTEGVVAGGANCKLLPFPNRSSTNIFADVTVPAGIETEANVCVKFGSNSWSSVGVLEIQRPPVVDGKIFHVSSSTALESLVTGEPFYVKVATQVPLSNLDMIKLVLANAPCGGTDPLADAVKGGTGINFNISGIAPFDSGIDSGEQQVKICIWQHGRPGYRDDGSARWAVGPPTVIQFWPVMTSVGVTTEFSVKGRGLATASVKTFMLICAGTACSASGTKYQLSSSDGMVGRSALLSAELWSSGQFTVCLEGGSSLMPVATLRVNVLPTIVSVMPTLLYRNNETSFLVKGTGLTSHSKFKLVEADQLCSGNMSLPGANWSGITAGGVSVDGTRVVSVGFIIPKKGAGRVCFAHDDQLTQIIDTGIIISIREWVTPILLSPRTENKTDTQRVEANMTDFVPACSANWKSKFMLQGPGGGIERDTPAIVDWQTDFKCYKRQEDLPIGVPSGYAPPGIDSRLVSTVRNMPIEFIIAGGVGVGDTIFISQAKCGDNLTNPLEDSTTQYVPGGQPVVVQQSMIIDATGFYCGGVRKDATFISSSVATTESLTGASGRSYGIKVTFTLTEISGVGQFHKLCVVPAGSATAFSVEKIDLKVRPPMLLAMEPPIVFSGMKMPYKLLGLGLSVGDRIKIMNGETFAGCEHLDDESDLRGGGTVTLNEQTISTSSRVEFTFEIPAKHARVCYQYIGSKVWGEMTDALSLATSGFIYGYENSLHFYYGETIMMQSGDNMVFGRNQTILVLGPSPKYLVGTEFVARKPFSLTIEGDGLTEKARYIVVPVRVACGGMPAGRVNLMKDKTGFSSVRLRTVIGGESRPPTIFSNDPVDSFEKMSQCTGSSIRDGCFAARATARNSVDYPVGVSIKNLGSARVCYLHDFAAEYQEVGQIQILAPSVSNIYPRVATLNIPLTITVTGISLRDTDRMKIVDGLSCNAPISSRPYTVAITVRDSPTMSSATADLTIAGKGTYTTGRRKVCYSYDKGVTYLDSGFTMKVVSPQIHRVFPTTIAIAGERRIWFFGDVISPGDRVKIIHKSRRCEGLDDWESTVYGGQGRPLDFMAVEGHVLPHPIGEAQWPAPWPNGSSVFTLQRSDEAVVCYLHRDGAGWEDVRGTDGKRIVITARDTSDLALGRTGPEWGNAAGASLYDISRAGLLVAVGSAVLCCVVFWCTDT